MCFKNLVPFFFNQKRIHIHNKYIDYSYYPIVPKLNDCYNCCSYNLKHLKKTKRQCTTPHHTKIFGHALFFKQRITRVYKLPKQTMLKISSFEIIIMKKILQRAKTWKKVHMINQRFKFFNPFLPTHTFRNFKRTIIFGFQKNIVVAIATTNLECPFCDCTVFFQF